MRVVIADDSGLLRDGLASLLTEAGVEVVARAADAEQLLAMVDEHAPDVAIVDIRMPPTYTHEGARAALELRQRQPGLGILLLSQSLESRYVTDLARPARPRLRLPAQGPGHRRPGAARRARTGSRPAAPCSTPRWSATCSAATSSPTSSTGSPTASARCSS